MRDKTLMNGKRTKEVKNNTRTKKELCKYYVDKILITVLSLYHRSHRDLLKSYIIGANQCVFNDKGLDAYSYIHNRQYNELCVGLIKMVINSAKPSSLNERHIGRKVLV